MKNKALELFCAIPKTHNCAQAVACGCGHCEWKETLASCGGGRAPEGRCGALHAAMLLAENDTVREEIRKGFVSENGFESCHELKAAGIPCAKCVECAAALAEKAQLIKG